MSSSTAYLRSLADATGALGSLACAVHCLLVPVLLVTGSILPLGVLGHEGFHRAMLWIVLPAGMLAFSLGCWKHKDRSVLVVGVLGLILILAAGTLGHDLLGEFWERTITVFAAALLITAHVRNFRLCRKQAPALGCDHA